MTVESSYYVRGTDAMWEGVVEVRTDGTWYWHANWPRRSTSVRYMRNNNSDHIATGFWKPMMDQDLIVDEGL